MSERFRWAWWGWLASSEGYAVRVLGRSNVEYRDEAGVLQIRAEAMAKYGDIVVYVSSIPDTHDRPREQVLDRLHRVFSKRGWNLLETNA